MLAEFIKLPDEGETVGRFHLKKLLSSSILGNFYQAKDTANSEEILLHIIPEALKRADPAFPGRYEKEVERQKKIKAGPAMPAKELINKDNHILVVYPAGRYQNLNDLILDSTELLPEALVQKIMLAVGRGLADAEQIGQGHYFLTPDFLFFNKEGEVCVAGIGLFQSIDFPAFEHFVSGSLVPISIDKSKSFSALEILSPELRNFKTRDSRTDFFCLGMCIYFLLLAQKPGRNWKQPRAIRDNICEGWDVLVTRCLEPRPIDRYPNYRSYIRDLENIENLSGATKREAGVLDKWLGRIPVPHWLERRLSRPILNFFRISISFITLFILLWAGNLAIESVFPGTGGAGGRIKVEQVDRQNKANIILTINPRMAVVEIQDAEPGRFLVRDGQLMLSGDPGKYTLTVKSSNRQPSTLQFEVGDSGPVERSVQLVRAFASVHVDGKPGTEVYVTGSEGILLHVGTIENEQGLLLEDRLLPGRYTFVGQHDNFEIAQLDSLNISSKSSNIAFKQTSKPASLGLTSSPEGASVYIDGSHLGETPIRIEGLEIGVPMHVRVEKPGFRPFVENVELSTGEGIRIDIGELTPLRGVVSYSLDLPEHNPPTLQELDLFINGKSVLVKLSDEVTLPAGKNTIRLEHPDYLPVETTFALDDGKRLSVELVLEPRPVRLFASVNTENPTRFLVNGQLVPRNPDGFIPLPAGDPVTVEVLVQNYLKVIQSFSGEANERIDWTVPLKAIPGPEFGNDWQLPYFDLSMPWIESGRFSMGSPVMENRRIPNEDNFTDVRFSRGFWIAQNEITQSVYSKLMGQNPSYFSKGADYPVDSVTWEQAVEFCRRLTDFEKEAGRLPDGFVYRLPTEAEWEFAARAGTQTAFSFGTDADPSMGNFQGAYTADSTLGKSADARYGTLPVGSFAPNAWGLYDVHGNVAEWILDLYWDRHPGGSVEDPFNDEKGEGHPIRGGSWEDPAYRVRSAARTGVQGDAKRNSIGFRIVLAQDVESIN